MKFTICAIPTSCWSINKRLSGVRGLIQDLIQDAFSIERRLSKRLNEDIERKRYNEVCELLENAVLDHSFMLGDPANAPGKRANDLFPATEIDGDYLDLLLKFSKHHKRNDHSDYLRLGTSIIPPGDVAMHANDFEELAIRARYKQSSAVANKLAFLGEYVIPHGCGVIEVQVQDFNAPSSFVRSTATSDKLNRISVLMHAARIGKSDEEILRHRVAMSLDDDTPVNMNNQNHIVITKVLAEFLLKDETKPPGRIRVIYADGSEAQPFPLRCLPPTPRPSISQEKEIHIALLSMRHLLLDKEVTINWFRNREIDLSSTLGQSDDYCFEHSRKQLEDLCKVYQGDRVLIRLYHTGFEPAVVGFYRAVVESLLKHGPWLRVLPQFFISDNEYSDGPSWPPVQGGIQHGD